MPDDIETGDATDTGWRAPGLEEIKQRIADDGWPALPLEDKEKRRQLGLLEDAVAKGQLLPARAIEYAKVVHDGGSIFGLPLDDTPATRELADRQAADRLADCRLMAAFAAVGQQKRMAPGDEETRKAVERVKDDPETQELVDQLRAELRSRALQSTRMAAPDSVAAPDPVRVVPRPREHGAGSIRRHRSQRKRDDGSSESDQPLVVAFGSNGDSFRLLVVESAGSIRRYLKAEISRLRRELVSDKPARTVTENGEPPTRKCELCGREFVPRRSDARFCPGGACKQRAWRKRERARRAAA
jgi:hypothetical protein